MNVIVVTHDSIFGRYVAASLASATRVDRVVIETAGAGWRFYARKLRRVGPLNFAFQALLNRSFRRDAATRLKDLPLPPHERVGSINELTFRPDDLVLAFGSSYVRAETLARAPNGILNLHTGLLPEFRGVKSEFWSLALGDGAGWTLHYMTPRLDAGDIVLRHAIPMADERPGALRARLLEDAVPRIVRFLEETRMLGVAAIRRTPQPEERARYFTTPTLRDWIAARRKRGAYFTGDPAR